MIEQFVELSHNFIFLDILDFSGKDMNFNQTMKKLFIR